MLAQLMAAMTTRPPLLKDIGQRVLGMGFDHNPLDELLSKHVRDGLVDYRGLREEKAKLRAYIKRMASVEPDRMPTVWDELAFWINAYNACALFAIVEHYPIKSVREIPGFFDRITYRIGQRPLTLDGIKHGKVRRFRDPRVHFALVCGAQSSPRLYARAFSPQRLERELDERARSFITDPAHIGSHLDRQANQLWLSALFRIYAWDFANPQGMPNLLAGLNPFIPAAKLSQFVSRYLPAEDVEYIKQRNPRLRFMPFDWRLNEAGVSGASIQTPRATDGVTSPS